MGEPIRVLHILQRMEPAGVQTLLMSIYRQIDRSKVQFDFLVHYETPQFFDDEVEKLGGHVYRLSFREDFNVIKYIKDLKGFFKEHTEYRIVHGHMHTLGAIYLRIAKKNNIPVRIAHSHTNNTQNDFKKYLKKFMNSLYGKYATDLMACSVDAGKYMFGSKEFMVVNNAIDSERFVFSVKSRNAKRKELGIESNLVVGNVGRFEIQKNQKFTLDVFEQLYHIRNDAKLLLIGTGSMENEIKEKVKSKQMEDAVMFLGNRRDVAELYHAMDVFL
ncbi:MAG: glycosyltransferase, partial [Anaerotignum sp.]|nr:glycosyltransferase [Anaerotignum sp.]